MSCYDLCSTAIGGINRPQPIADSGNEPCVRQCPDTTTVIQPPPVVVTFPGPFLSSFPQDSVVGSSGAPVLGGYGGYGSLGYGGLYGYGGSLGYRGLYGYGRPYGSGYCSPYSYWYNRYSRGSCGPC
ncbi:Scale keratin [Pygoscelis adeliae]|uniref:Keratin n=1 Tax=Pygoscelis adeliae TaxID=9238 RepID=A0A093NW84_PYGAD|nr:PREDICTED: scale keratin-like [Pygoscelis adeliae]KFW66235.1 Scale keratin [Pygoscelis adeliae]